MSLHWDNDLRSYFEITLCLYSYIVMVIWVVTSLPYYLRIMLLLDFVFYIPFKFRIFDTFSRKSQEKVRRCACVWQTCVCTINICSIRINFHPQFSALYYQKEESMSKNSNRKIFFVFLASWSFVIYCDFNFCLFANVTYFKLLRTSTLLLGRIFSNIH